MKIHALSRLVLTSLLSLPLVLSGCGDDEPTGGEAGETGDGDGDATGDGDGDATGDGDGDATGDGDGDATGDGDGDATGDGDGDATGDGDGDATGDGDGDATTGDGDGDADACMTCLETSCEEHLSGCIVDPNCTCWNDCVTSGQTYGTCINECGGPPSQDFNALAMCLDQFCAVECEGN